MKRIITALTAAVLLLTACGSKTSQTSNDYSVYNEEQNLPGDSTLYGLACEGCTDSVVIFLPFSGGDPDTFNVINARKHHKVFGRPRIGDELAIVRNATEKQTADIVVNLDILKGEWCYKVMPQFRPRLGQPAQGKAPQLPPTLPDSLRKAWTTPREYGIDIRREHVAHPIGMTFGNDNEQSPVVFPPVKLYREWRIHNGQLLLKESRIDSLGNHQVFNCDTADIVLLRRDTLVLRFKDSEQGYYRR